ncbi:MAG: DNA polymerase III subunit alpha [Variovorax sp.]
MFVHLRLHTELSVVDGTNRIEEVVRAAAADGQPAVAVTDINNLFGAVKFYKAARAAGVKPLLGTEIFLESLIEDSASPTRVVLLVQDQRGYLNLSELLARCWTRNLGRGQAQPTCKLEWLAELNEGLLLLSGAQAGPLGAALLQAAMPGEPSRADEIALRLAALFRHRFYIELQRAGRREDEPHVAAAVQLAARLDLPVVATHPVQFPTRADFEAHEARVCIAEGEILGNQRRQRRFTPEQYFKSAAEMEALFADVPSAIANAAEIAKRCNLTLALGKPQLPDFPTPETDGVRMPIAEYFQVASHQGLERRLERLYPDANLRAEKRPQYVERLEFEIATILKMGFPGYFLIVGDFINWAKQNGCPVGPGRGSGAGSLVAYALNITDLDPLQYQLLFERFLNPERVSMPDFDIDFCQSNRDRVIDYVKDKYGREAVSQIVTFGTMAARAAIRDVGRVLDMSYTFCDGISKLIPNKPGQPVTLQYPPQPKPAGDKTNYAIEMEPQLAQRIEREEEVRTLVELAQKLEGLARNVGMHAGGVLIAPGKLTDFCPLYQQPGGDAAVSQFDKDDVEAIGLVKFDFLGLATLTIMEIAKDLITKRHPQQQPFSYDDIPLDDPHTYKLFADGKTEAVFQFESRGMQGMLKDARPTRLEDLIALNALYRPGPMDLIPSFVARKHGREPVEYPHPLVAEMLSETYGIMVYQEQVMQTAQILGGYSLGGADLLRRAMGKKKAEEMAEHRQIFRAGAAGNGIGQRKADEIFDLMEKFAGYGFNKSHAAAYSLLAYQTGWLKVHYTAEFFAANMTVEMDDTDKLKLLHDDAVKNFALAFEPPDINRGIHRFEPVSDTLIRYGLGAVKGTGQHAIEAIVAARDDGVFTSLFDFCRRVDRNRVNKRAVDALIKAGAFDALGPDRATLAGSLDLAFEFANAAAANADQGGLFDGVDDNDTATAHGSSTQEPALLPATPWGVKERLTLEKGAVGFYLSGHLFDEVASEVRRFCPRRIADLLDSREPQLIAGIVSGLRVINGMRGRLALFVLDDATDVIEATADEGVFNANRAVLKDDELVVVSGRLQPGRGGFEARFTVQQVWDLATARCRFGKFLQVAVNGRAPDVAHLVKNFPPRLAADEMGETRRGLPVRLSLARGGARVELQLGDEARFFPSDAALAGWQAQVGSGGAATVVYE